MHLKFFVEREYSNFYDKLQVKLYKYKVDSYSFYLFFRVLFMLMKQYIFRDRAK